MKRKRFSEEQIIGILRESGAEITTKATYTNGDIELLKNLWLAAGQPCGKRFAGEMLGLWLDSWQRHHGSLSDTQRDRLLRISAAQIDRVLAPHRCASKKRRIANRDHLGETFHAFE